MPFLKTKLYCQAVEHSCTVLFCITLSTFFSHHPEQTLQMLYCLLLLYFFLRNTRRDAAESTLRCSKGASMSWIVLLLWAGSFWAVLSFAFSQREKWINLMKDMLNFLVLFSIRNFRALVYFIPFGILVEHMEALHKTCAILCFLLV